MCLHTIECSPCLFIKFRYGDKKEYCNDVTRERCLTEARVYTDCCKTCEGLVAPPGVCLDTAANCVPLTHTISDCYSDLIYGQFNSFSKI